MNPPTLPGHYDPPDYWPPEFHSSTPEIPRDDAGHLAAAEAKRQRKAAKREACRCEHCKELRGKRYRQDTKFVEEEQNWVTLCGPCREANDEHWADMWNDFYSGCL